jgi:hypothetical protein
LPERGSDLRWSKNRRRNLVQEGLEDVVVTSVNQHNVRIGALQSPRRREASESPADDHDALSLLAGRTRRRQGPAFALPGCIRGSWSKVLQSFAHRSPLVRLAHWEVGSLFGTY